MLESTTYNVDGNDNCKLWIQLVMFAIIILCVFATFGNTIFNKYNHYGWLKKKTQSKQFIIVKKKKQRWYLLVIFRKCYDMLKVKQTHNH